MYIISKASRWWVALVQIRESWPCVTVIWNNGMSRYHCYQCVRIISCFQHHNYSSCLQCHISHHLALYECCVWIKETSLYSSSNYSFWFDFLNWESQEKIHKPILSKKYARFIKIHHTVKVISSHTASTSISLLKTDKVYILLYWVVV